MATAAPNEADIDQHDLRQAVVIFYVFVCFFFVFFTIWLLIIVIFVSFHLLG